MHFISAFTISKVHIKICNACYRFFLYKLFDNIFIVIDNYEIQIYNILIESNRKIISILMKIRIYIISIIIF